MTFGASQVQSLNITSGKKTTSQSVHLLEGARYTLGVKNNAAAVVANLVSLLNSQGTVLAAVYMECVKLRGKALGSSSFCFLPLPLCCTSETAKP